MVNDAALLAPVPISLLVTRPPRPTRRPVRSRPTRFPSAAPTVAITSPPTEVPNIIEETTLPSAVSEDTSIPTGTPFAILTSPPSAEKPHYWFGLIWPPTKEPTL